MPILSFLFHTYISTSRIIVTLAVTWLDIKKNAEVSFKLQSILVLITHFIKTIHVTRII